MITSLVCIEVFAIFVSMILSTGETVSAISSRNSLVFLAEFLIDQDVHPTIIVDGYKKAARKTKEFLEEIWNKRN